MNNCAEHLPLTFLYVKLLNHKNPKSFPIWLRMSVHLRTIIVSIVDHLHFTDIAFLHVSDFIRSTLVSSSQ